MIWLIIYIVGMVGMFCGFAYVNANWNPVNRKFLATIWVMFWPFTIIYLIVSILFTILTSIFKRKQNG